MNRIDTVLFFPFFLVFLFLLPSHSKEVPAQTYLVGADKYQLIASLVPVLNLT